MYNFDKYTQQIMDRYRTNLELIDTIAIGFTGVAGERPAPIFTNVTSEDALYFGLTVNFNNAGVLIRLRTISPQYDWMADDSPIPQDTPINALAGIFSQALPVLPLVRPFFIKKQGRLQMQWTNAASSPITGGLITYRALRLTNPINGGWDYSVGFNN